ncbi:MAG: hypothetical protein AB1714_25635 [Acidobacteriota bacterium]
MSAILLRRRLWPLPLGVAFLLFFHRVLIRGEVFFFRDHYQEYYPLKHLALQMVRQGEIPAWNPASMMGQPFLANPNWTLLYPPNLLLAAGPFPQTYSIVFAAHFLLVLLGFYYMCRVVERSPAASAAGAICYGCGGYFLSQGSFMPFLFTMAWQPLVLAEILRNADDASPRRRWALIGAGAMLLLGGEPVTIINTGIIALVLLYERLSGKKRLGAGLRRLFLDYRYLALLLVAVALYPRFLFLLSSGRLGGISLDMASGWPLPLRMIPTIIVPNLFGDVHEYTPWRFLGASMTPHRFPYLLSLYIGAPCLILASAHVVRRRAPWIEAAVCVLSILLALGTATPLFELFWENVPLASLIRYPIKFFFLPVFFTALWAAFGFDRLREEVRAWRIAAAAGCIIAAAVLIVGWCYGPQAVIGAVGGAIPVEKAAELSTWIRMKAAYALCIVAVSLLSMWLIRRGRSWPLVGVITVDLFIANSSLNPTVAADFYRPQQLAGLVRSPDERTMVLAPFKGVGTEVGEPYRTYSHYLNTGGRAELYALSGADSGVHYAFDPSIDRSFSPATQKLIDGLRGKSFAQAKPVFDLVAVRWFLSPEPLEASGIGLRQVHDRPPASRLYVYENLTALPRVFVFGGIPRVVPEVDRQVEALYSGFDPRRDLLLGEVPRLLHGPASTGSTARIAVNTPSRLSVDVDCASSAYLFCSDTYHPDWDAWLDGRPARVLRANVCFRAVEVPAGRHRVEFRCKLARHYLSCAAVLVLFLLVCVGLVRSRLRSVRQSENVVDGAEGAQDD